MEFTVQLETNNSKVTQEKGRCKGDKWYQEMVPDAICLHRGGSDLFREVKICASGNHKKAEASHAHS